MQKQDKTKKFGNTDEHVFPQSFSIRGISMNSKMKELKMQFFDKNKHV